MGREPPKPRRLASRSWESCDCKGELKAGRLAGRWVLAFPKVSEAVGLAGSEAGALPRVAVASPRSRGPLCRLLSLLPPAHTVRLLTDGHLQTCTFST